MHQLEIDVKNAVTDMVNGMDAANLSDTMTYELVSRLVKQTLLNDMTIQFLPLGIPPIAVAGALAGATVHLAITDGDGTTNTLNSLATVVITAAGGTAPLLNGAAGPLTVTFASGLASVIVSDSAAGVITLSLSSPTHPLVDPLSIAVASTAIVTLS